MPTKCLWKCRMSLSNQLVRVKLIKKSEIKSIYLPQRPPVIALVRYATLHLLAFWGTRNENDTLIDLSLKRSLPLGTGKPGPISTHGNCKSDHSSRKSTGEAMMKGQVLPLGLGPRFKWQNMWNRQLWNYVTYYCHLLTVTLEVSKVQFPHLQGWDNYACLIA